MSNIMKPTVPETSAVAVSGVVPNKPASPRFGITRRRVGHGVALLVLLAVVLLAAFGPSPWQLLGQALLLLATAVGVLLALTVVLMTVGIAIFTRSRSRTTRWLDRTLRQFTALMILLLGLLGAALGSQWHASTPPMLSVNGQPLPGSIATMEQVTLGGSQQWVTIRGKNSHNPVLLFLMGGPGAGGFPDNSFFLTPATLEDHFVVVNWDQPGTGRSSQGISGASLTPQRYVDDAYALTQLLRARFQQDKIYVLGSSWGTILGIELVQQHPELFYAYIGHGQMVNTTQNDVLGYQFALKYVAEHNDSVALQTLRQNGPPPYSGAGMIWKYAAYLDVLNRSMDAMPILQTLLLASALTPEYGLLDKAGYVPNFSNVFSVVYPQLRDLDFTRSATRLYVPVYLLAGRADVNAMSSLTEQYYQVLQAPHKELIWFKSGHSMTGADADQFADVMVNHVLKQTWPGR